MPFGMTPPHWPTLALAAVLILVLVVCYHVTLGRR